MESLLQGLLFNSNQLTVGVTGANGVVVLPNVGVVMKYVFGTVSAEVASLARVQAPQRNRGNVTVIRAPKKG